MWFRVTHGESGNGYIIASTTLIAGEKAIYLRPKKPGPDNSYGSYNLNFIRKGNAYSVYFDGTTLSREEITYIIDSFSFNPRRDKLEDLFINF